MTDTVDIAWIGMGGAVIAIIRDVWVRSRTDHKEFIDRQDRIDKEAKEEEAEERAVADAEAEKQREIAEAERSATAETVIGVLSLTDAEKARLVRACMELERERDDALENVRILRLALDQVVSALSQDIGRMRQDLAREQRNAKGKRAGPSD